MAVISKADQGGGGGGGSDSGAAPPTPGGGGPPPELRTNLPPKTAPICGRRPEMQRVVEVFQRSMRDGLPGRVEIVGPLGSGASTVALELARRAGGRFPGGAWYMPLSMGVDVAWADLAATRGRTHIRDLADAARQERERCGGDPRCLLVLDGATTHDELMSALPPSEGRTGPDIFIVAERPLGSVDAEQVVEVSPVPPHAARRIAHAVVHSRDPEAKPPAVRVLDGLGLTAGLAARAALAMQAKGGPVQFADARAVTMRLVPFVAQVPAALELMLVCAVAHPVRIPVDALCGALAHVRKGRGREPTADEVGNGILWLARAGMVQPDDDRRVSMHPMIQEIVRGMAQSPEDLAVATEAFATGLCDDAEEAVTEEGVDFRRAAIHQLRAVRGRATGAAQERVGTVLAKIEGALGATAATKQA